MFMRIYSGCVYVSSAVTCKRRPVYLVWHCYGIYDHQHCSCLCHSVYNELLKTSTELRKTNSELRKTSEEVRSLKTRLAIVENRQDPIEGSLGLLTEVTERHAAQLAPVVVNVDQKPTQARELDMVRGVDTVKDFQHIYFVCCETVTGTTVQYEYQ